MTEHTEHEQEQSPFAAWLRDQNAGRLHQELTEQFHRIVEAVRETGKTGTLQLTVKVGPFRGDTDTLQVDDRVSVKVPEHDRKTSLWFPDGENNLHRSDPRQSSFDFDRVMEG